MGKHQARLLRFFLRYPNSWHSVSYHDENAIRATRNLKDCGLVQIAPRTRGQNLQARIMVGDRFKQKGNYNAQTY